MAALIDAADQPLDRTQLSALARRIAAARREGR